MSALTVPVQFVGFPHQTTTIAWPGTGVYAPAPGLVVTTVGQLTLDVTAARSAVTRLHIAPVPAPLVAAVLPASNRAPSRAASEVAMAYVYPRPSSIVPATSSINIGSV